MDKVEKVAQLREETSRFLVEVNQSIWREAFANCGCGETSVRDYIEVQGGYAFRSEWFTTRGVRLARNINVGHGALDWEDCACLDPLQADQFERFALHEGDTLISLDRPIISTGLKVATVREADLPALLVQRVGRPIFKRQDVLPRFFFHWLKSPLFICAIDPGRSNGVPHISQRDIERIPFSPPSVDVQRTVIRELDRMEELAAGARNLQKEVLREIEALPRALLARAFRGEF
jgi:type I restriction enzyme S subunit